MEYILEELLAGRPITLRGPTELEARREGNRIIFEERVRGKVPLLDQLLRFVQLVDAVGADRVRQCRLEGCGKWFIASKGQRYCTLEHGNRDGYLRWKERQKG